MQSTAGSSVLLDTIVTEEAWAVQTLRHAGAIILGKVTRVS